MFDRHEIEGLKESTLRLKQMYKCVSTSAHVLLYKQPWVSESLANAREEKAFHLCTLSIVHCGNRVCCKATTFY